MFFPHAGFLLRKNKNPSCRARKKHLFSKNGGDAKMKCDIVIIGAGPAGIFTALELVRGNSRKKIVMVEKGNPMQKRRCPKNITGQCVNCRPYCHITTGFSGAGAFSDGKLSLSCEVGGDLPELIGEELAQKTIEYTDGIYL